MQLGETALKPKGGGTCSVENNFMRLFQLAFWNIYLFIKCIPHPSSKHYWWAVQNIQSCINLPFKYFLKPKIQNPEIRHFAYSVTSLHLPYLIQGQYSKCKRNGRRGMFPLALLVPAETKESQVAIPSFTTIPGSLGFI